MKRYRVKPGSRVELAERDPDDRGKYAGKDGREKAEAEVARLNGVLADLQRMLYASGDRALLLILQAMDTGGKDGTIRHVFTGLNPQGVSVTSFKAPSPEELAHDFLWRVHRAVPARGMIGVFNRSHYEDVLITRVHGLIPDKVAERRFAQINDFERMLVQNGTAIIKVFLHISKDEQRERLQARLDQPDKRWKFNPGDLAERERWADYQRVYQDALSATSTDEAPWHVVPANHKWYRDLVISRLLEDALNDMKLEYPRPAEKLDELVVA